MGENTQKTGFLIINKPLFITSHDVVGKLRRITGIRKIGHAGTLDPLAEGVLILAIGRESTKKIDAIIKTKKEYEAKIFLGKETETYDKEGKIVNEKEDLSPINEEDVKKIIDSFKGEQLQVPPMHSAKKVGGKKLYNLARKGVEIERAPSLINIFNIEIVSYQWPILDIKVECSSGTYIRSLAFDIGRKLGCGAYLEGLKRVAIGDVRIKDALDIPNINKDNWEKLLRDIV